VRRQPMWVPVCPPAIFQTRVTCDAGDRSEVEATRFRLWGLYSLAAAVWLPDKPTQVINLTCPQRYCNKLWMSFFQAATCSCLIPSMNCIATITFPV